MTNALNINAAVMLLVSFVFAYLSLSLVPTTSGPSAYGMGFMFGRAISGVLLPLFLVWAPRALFRRKPIFTKGAIVTWWVLFLLLSIMGLIGGMLPQEG